MHADAHQCNRRDLQWWLRLGQVMLGRPEQRDLHEAEWLLTKIEWCLLLPPASRSRYAFLRAEHASTHGALPASTAPLSARNHGRRSSSVSPSPLRIFALLRSEW